MLSCLVFIQSSGFHETSKATSDRAVSLRAYGKKTHATAYTRHFVTDIYHVSMIHSPFLLPLSPGWDVEGLAWGIAIFSPAHAWPLLPNSTVSMKHPPASVFSLLQKAHLKLVHLIFWSVPSQNCLQFFTGSLTALNNIPLYSNKFKLLYFIHLGPHPFASFPTPQTHTRDRIFHASSLKLLTQLGVLLPLLCHMHSSRPFLLNFPVMLQAESRTLPWCQHCSSHKPSHCTCHIICKLLLTCLLLLVLRINDVSLAPGT